MATKLVQKSDSVFHIQARVVQNRFWKREPNVAYWREDDFGVGTRPLHAGVEEGFELTVR